VGFNSYKVTLHFMAGDVDGGANSGNFVVRKYDGTSWSATTTGTRTSTSVEAQGLTSFSDLAVGEALQYSLNVTTSGSGTVAKSPDQASYPSLSTVTLTATASSGWHFASWSGDASGSANPLTVTMDGNKNIAATFLVNAPKTWLGASGGGDGSSWAVAGNWSGGSVPGSGDNVVLDNGTVAGSYTVNLPGGATTVSINRLTITPAATRTITLVLPSGNTANPGLRVGDATAGTDDIILDSGAVLRNSSGASAGNGVEANSTANGTVRINNGSRFVHNTLRGTAGVAPLLSVVSGTETGEFEYDVPGTASFSLNAAGRT